MTQITLTLLKRMFVQKNRETSSLKMGSTASQLLLGGILLFTSILAFAPLYPGLPGASLDPSWILAMNQAVEQGTVFGKDLIFTYGPYSALLTQAYHPVTYPWMLVLGLLLGIGYASMLLMNLNKKVNWQLWLFAVFLILIDSRDALFFSYPLLVVLTAGKLTLTSTDPRRSIFSQRRHIDYALAVALLGLLPIVKGSLLPLSVAAGLAGFILHWRIGDRIIALMFIALPLITMVVLWHLAGQPITALPDFFQSMSPIVSGFAEAMSTFPDSSWWVMKIGIPGMIVTFITMATLFLAAIYRERTDSIVHTVVIFLYVALFIFIAFKAGFVRHDAVHVPAASSALIFAALALNIFSLGRFSVLIWFSIAFWALIHWHYFGASLYPSNPVNQSPIHSLHGVIKGDRMGGRLQASFSQRLEKIHNESSIQKFNGTTDIYPYDQAALIASGNNWVSRPIPQSYSVYTPTLAKINEAHLRGPQAPDNIIFRVGTIDNRYPSIDDGLSWPTLISHYEISDKDKQYIYLKKRPTPVESKMSVVMEGSQKLGKNISVPQGEHIFFAEIDVEPTILGRLATIAFKPTPLYITVDLADGQIKRFRFIPSMAKTGFILSPLIKSTSDFTQLAGGQLPSLKQSMVNNIRIAPAGSESMFWNRDYLLKISILEPNPNPALHTQTLSSRLLTKLPE
jgi:hypothetical protein